MMRTLSSALAAGAIVLSTTPTGRAQPQRVAWRFEMPSNLPGPHIAVSDDGTVYATDNLRLYSLTPQGELNWTMPGAGGGRPITFGRDGTIYTSAQGVGVRAINPDGSLQWEYLPPDPVSLHTGPNVGPDGNIYAVQEVRAGDGLGAFSLAADGDLRWFNEGDPLIGPADLSNSDVVFGADRFFAGMDFPRGHGAVTYAFTFDGEQVGYSGGGGWGIPAASFPRMMLDGRIIYRYGQTGLMAVQQNGTVDWQLLHPGGANFVADPSVGSDGTIYSGNWSGIRLWAVNPDGTSRWVRGAENGLLLDSVAIAPDNSVIVATGTPGWVRGYNANNGDLLWRVDLPPEEGLAQYANTFRAAFSPDSRTAYITSRFVSGGVGHSYLYAIQTGDLSSYHLEVSDLVGGQEAVFTVNGATPNLTQYIVYSLRGPGSTFIPKLNVTLDLRSPALLSSGTADANGDFATSINVPRAASGRTVWFQGAEQDRTTNSLSEIVQ